MSLVRCGNRGLRIGLRRDSQFAIGDLGEFAFEAVVRLVECLDDVVDNVGRNRAGVGVAGA